jgi:hypothetical protein
VAESRPGNLKDLPEEYFVMEFTIPVYAKALCAALRERGRRAPDGDASRAAAVPSRLPAQLFRRATPTTFQRCLAVHMHFAQHHSALD